MCLPMPPSWPERSLNNVLHVLKYSTSLTEKEYPFLPRSTVTVMLYELGCLLYWLVTRGDSPSLVRHILRVRENICLQCFGTCLQRALFFGRPISDLIPYHRSLGLWGDLLRQTPPGTDFPKGNRPLPVFAYQQYVSYRFLLNSHGIVIQNQGRQRLCLQFYC